MMHRQLETFEMAAITALRLPHRESGTPALTPWVTIRSGAISVATSAIPALTILAAIALREEDPVLDSSRSRPSTHAAIPSPSPGVCGGTPARLLRLLDGRADSPPALKLRRARLHARRHHAPVAEQA